MHQFSDFRIIPVFTVHIKDMFSVIKQLIRCKIYTFNRIKWTTFAKEILLRKDDRISFR